MSLDLIDLIKKNISGLKHEFQLNSRDMSNVKIEFSNFALGFFWNYRYRVIECKLILPDGRKYELREVLLKLNTFKSDRIRIIDSGTPEEQVNAYLDIINYDLKKLFNGNLDWADDIDIQRSNIKWIQHALGTMFIVDHPIYKKMISGDNTWVDDLRKIK